MKHSFIFVFLFLASFCFAQDFPAGFDEYAEAARKAWNVPGIAIAIVKNDKVIYARGFEYREFSKIRLSSPRRMIFD